MWACLRSEGFPEDVVAVLAKLYETQWGHVRGQRQGRSFKINRGTRQGDPLGDIMWGYAAAEIMHRLQNKLVDLSEAAP